MLLYYVSRLKLSGDDQWNASVAQSDYVVFGHRCCNIHSISHPPRSRYVRCDQLEAPTNTARPTVCSPVEGFRIVNLRQPTRNAPLANPDTAMRVRASRSVPARGPRRSRNIRWRMEARSSCSAGSSCSSATYEPHPCAEPVHSSHRADLGPEHAKSLMPTTPRLRVPKRRALLRPSRKAQVQGYVGRVRRARSVPSSPSA